MTPFITVLLFFASFLSFVLLLMKLYLVNHNKRAKIATAQFMADTQQLQPKVFTNVRIRYWETNYHRTWVSPNSTCDLYLFDNYLVIVRRMHFILKAEFSPLLISPEPTGINNRFRYLDSYQPGRIVFNKVNGGQVDIRLKHPVHQHAKIDITLKGLTGEQLQDLQVIRNW